MFPCFAIYDRGDRASGHAVFQPKKSMRNPSIRVIVSDVSHFLFSEFSGVDLLALAEAFRVRSRAMRCTTSTYRAAATFLIHIIRIVFIRAQKQMGRIYAETVIACMKDAQLFRDGLVVDFPRQAVCPYEYLLADPKLSVPGRTGRANPFPADIALANLIPKSLKNGYVEVSHCGFSLSENAFWLGPLNRFNGCVGRFVF